MKQSTVLITGATGYIGGRLVPRLLNAGYRVRCLVRDATRLQGRAWRDDVETIEGDVLRPESLANAMRDAAVADYLVHSLGAGADFSERDVQAARNFAAAAKSEGVERIIYLGGLGRPRHGSLRASALAASDRRRIAGKRRASHRVSRGSDRRIGQSVL